MSNRIYIAGPMSGKPNFNYEAFHDAAFMLRHDGWEVFNPAEKDEEYDFSDLTLATGDYKQSTVEGFNFRKAYAWDVLAIINGDAIYMLEGWEQSPGARGEHAVATAMKAKYPEYRIIYEYEE